MISLVPTIPFMNLGSRIPAVAVGFLSVVAVGLPLMIIGAVAGALYGFVRGIFRAVTRKPLSGEKVERIQASLKELPRTLSDMSSVHRILRAQNLNEAELDAQDRMNVINERKVAKIYSVVMNRYAAIKSRFSSASSQDIILSMQGEAVFQDDSKGPVSTRALLNKYLVENATKNNGKKLFAILGEVLGESNPNKAEFRKNVTILAQGKRDATSLFSVVPKDVLGMIADLTVPSDTYEGDEASRSALLQRFNTRT